MKWLAKDRYNIFDIAGIALMTPFLYKKEYLAACLTLIAASLLSAAARIFSKKGDKT